ncbi:hypothetical protein FB451DRAFT_1171349 [Mycena latifolia]|nr:hypothetical protein FB451DRAFT_1171349 [Mycena latifolia]
MNNESTEDILRPMGIPMGIGGWTVEEEGALHIRGQKLPMRYKMAIITPRRSEYYKKLRGERERNEQEKSKIQTRCANPDPLGSIVWMNVDMADVLRRYVGATIVKHALIARLRQEYTSGVLRQPRSPENGATRATEKKGSETGSEGSIPKRAGTITNGSTEEPRYIEKGPGKSSL